MCRLATTRLKLLLCPGVCPTVLSWVLLYMLPLSHAISKCKGISYHCYADDIQLYVAFQT